MQSDSTDVQDAVTPAAAVPKRDEVLSFKVPGRPLKLSDVADEFSLMRSFLNPDKPLNTTVARRICEKSGTHLIKMVSPRTDGDQALLFIKSAGTNRNPTMLPSVNGPDIPFAKVIFRPLEIMDHPTMSLVDHVMNPINISEDVLAAFARVFGNDVLDTIKSCLGKPPAITALGSGEFPIIFIPAPGGGDLQVTPVAPATAYSGMKEVIAGLRQTAQGPRVPRDQFHKQIVSSKMQNISGAIGGPRLRLLAVMPPVMTADAAELYRFSKGGSFPRWRDSAVAEWVLKYADLLDRHDTFNNKDTRAGLDAFADRLIKDAAAFISDTLIDAKDIARGADEETPFALPTPPRVDQVLLRRYWAKGTFDRARRVLSSDHFRHRMAHVKEAV